MLLMMLNGIKGRLVAYEIEGAAPFYALWGCWLSEKLSRMTFQQAYTQLCAHSVKINLLETPKDERLTAVLHSAHNALDFTEASMLERTGGDHQLLVTFESHAPEISGGTQV